MYFIKYDNLHVMNIANFEYFFCIFRVIEEKENNNKIRQRNIDITSWAIAAPQFILRVEESPNSTEQSAG